MRKSYRVAPGHEFNYPADKRSQQIIEHVGGRRNLTEDQKKLVTYKTVTEGQDCSDMPESTRDLYVDRGWILVEETVGPAKQKEVTHE